MSGTTVDAQRDLARQESLRWVHTVERELAPVQAAYDGMTVTPGAAGDPSLAHAAVDDYGVGPLLAANLTDRLATDYCYAFVASPTLNDAVSGRVCWTVGVDYGDGRSIAHEVPVGTDPVVIAPGVPRNGRGRARDSYPAAGAGMSLAPVDPAERVLQVTAGVGSIYRIERRYVGESVTELVVVRVEGGSIEDLTTPGAEVFRVAEDGGPIEWACLSGIVAAAVAAEIEAGA